MLKIFNGIILGIGIVCIVLGIILAWIIVGDFHVNSKVWGIHFDSNATIQDLGTTLAGTAGVLITIAGVAFFTVSLLQTTSEMGQTRDLLSNQLSESTFFNLIRHHRELAESYRGDTMEEHTLDAQMLHVQNRVESYSRGIANKKFEHAAQTHYTPEKLYIENGAVKAIGESLIHTSNLIAQKLNNDKFYHNTHLLNLSFEEKYILGMIILNQLENIPVVYEFKGYTDVYLKESTYINRYETGYFPPIDFTELNGGILLPRLDAATAKMYEETIKRKTQLNIISLQNDGFIYKFVRVDYKYCVVPENYPRSFGFKNSLFPDTEGNISLYEIFTMFIPEIYPKGYSIELEVTFIISCPYLLGQNVEFEVKHPDIVISSYFQPLAENMPSEYKRMAEKWQTDGVFRITVKNKRPAL